MKNVLILGSYSGRNAGDAAILASIIRDLRELDDSIKFEVPTLNPKFVKNSFDDYVKAVSVLPWNLSLKLLGLPTIRSVNRSDICLITDAVLYDVKLFNPLFNNLFGLSTIVRQAKKKGKPVVCYNCGVGPISTSIGKKLMRYIGNNCDLVIVRDEYSRDLLKEVGVLKPEIHVKADSALNNVPVERSEAQKILKSVGVKLDNELIGFNITKYVDTWIAKGEERIDKSGFQKIIARTVDRVIDSTGATLVFVVTQPMDSSFVKETLGYSKHNQSIKIINEKGELTHNEIMGVLGEMDLFVGMRYHSLILSAGMFTPIVGLAYTPKVDSLLAQIGYPDNSVKFNGFNETSFYETIMKAWATRYEIKEKSRKNIKNLKKMAKESALLLKERFL